MIKKINKHPILVSFLLTVASVFLVNIFSVPNPNVVLITLIVYLTFLYGYSAGIMSGTLIVIYSMYFFSQNHSFFCFGEVNLKKIIVICIFTPLLILMVGSLKKQNMMELIELAKEKEKFEQMSKIDYLTGVYNRKYFNEVYVQKVKQSQINPEYIAILIIDIDFFKQFNDSYGHIAGDDCIRLVAETIQDEVNHTSDFLARYGGEEFVVICSDTQQELAKEKAFHILNAVMALNIPHNRSVIHNYVTVSIGVATGQAPGDLENYELLDKADRALYLAKSKGRNQVVVFGEE